MTISADQMRWNLYICLMGMAVLAILYLRGRKLSVPEYLRWGLLVVILPILGPYIVIASRPGENRP